MLAAVNDPGSDAPRDGVAEGGAVVVLKEFTSAVPDRLETPSEITRATKFSEPSALMDENAEA